MSDLSGKDDSLDRLLQSARSLVHFAATAMEDPRAVPGQRMAAANVVLQDRSDNPAVLSKITSWLDPVSDPKLQFAAVRMLAESGGHEMPGLLLGHLHSLSPATRTAAVEALLSREAWSLALLEQEEGTPVTVFDATQRARLSRHPSPKVRAFALQKTATASPRSQVLEAFRPALALPGNSQRGQQVFLARCAACHNIDGAGPGLGPDLKSISAHPAEKILINIIDPGLDVQPGFFGYEAKLNDGTVLYGLVTSETSNSITFKLTDGSTRLMARQDLSELRTTGQSLMPVGLEAGLSPQDMADLIAWLRGGSRRVPS